MYRYKYFNAYVQNTENESLTAFSSIRSNSVAAIGETGVIATTVGQVKNKVASAFVQINLSVWVAIVVQVTNLRMREGPKTRTFVVGWTQIDVVERLTGDTTMFL